jgi:acyl dehydratase
VADAPIGKRYPAFEYEVGREKIREYANAVGESNPVHHDPEAAKAAGFRGVVAPPMFCVVYSAGAMGPAILDPELGINLMMMVHGGQEFEWGEPVCAGDTIVTTAHLKDVSEKNGMKFYVFESESTNQEGQTTVNATWTNIVRGS